MAVKLINNYSLVGDMSGDVLVLLAGILAILGATGVLFTRDDFYAALYLCLTMIFVSSMYAAYNIQQVVVLLTLIFVGVVGAVTIVVAATYETRLPREPNKVWAAFAAVVFIIVASAYYSITTELKISGDFAKEFATVPTEYFLVLVVLFTLMILIVLSAIKLVRRVEL